MGTAVPRKSSGSSPTRAVAAVVRIVALYVLAGALAEVLSGGPSDLPAVLQDMAAWDLEGLFFLLIALELMTAVIAIIAPAVGWPFLACMLLGFLTVLTLQLGALGDVRDFGGLLSSYYREVA